VTSAARTVAWAGLAAAVALGAWAVVTVVCGDPLTSVYTAHEQRTLTRQLRHEQTTRLRDGAAFGRIVVPRLRLSVVVVQGTSAADLRRGPGHYPMTSLPGSGGTVAIAGHRTTWLHPFRHIDELRKGDAIDLRMPYGRFVYRVTGHRVVAADDWSIIRKRPWEQLVLSACHPLYSASHRWVVFAVLAT
jgi:LPXTG-site transpeptidase (sortase) family protein